ncbi:Flavohemoprotein (Hemoglobin-like protein) (Flavohemoglobin) (Nitric oxide dioxygenase) [Polaromonas sp. CG9_12]|nr:Flavohemoprotein (Hemoglobin-like protein) (Flavohemoglobin) (Nitric oxide dioxygenase) [Polaromonas sp. CG9_12]
MLTPEQRAIVKSTVPLLQTGGEALTTLFYRIMLAEHPEARPFFNQAHQANGDQLRALVNGVLMYARNIDRLDQLGGLVNQIIQKHVSLQIEPAHYPEHAGEAQAPQALGPLSSAQLAEGLPDSRDANAHFLWPQALHAPCQEAAARAGRA